MRPHPPPSDQDHSSDQDPPSDFDAHLQRVFGDDLERFLNHPPIPRFVRANALKATPAQVAAALAAYGIEARAHPAVPGALELTRQPPGVSPGLCIEQFLGRYTIQSLASMVPPLLLDPQPGERVLDLCAAPGSKTTQMAIMMRGQGELWANELIGKRINALASRLDATGAAHVVLLNAAGETLPRRLGVRFDRVLADVPCTGLGRRENLDANRRRHRQRKGGAKLPDLQYRLLLAAGRLARVGGRVVYSTCSLDPEEDERVVHQLISRLPFRLVEPPSLPGLTTAEGRTRVGVSALDGSLALARRITPFENPTEGFFVALLEKTGPLEGRFETPPSPTFDAERAPTLAHDHPEVAPILDDLAVVHGVARERLANARYLFSRAGDKLALVAPQLEQAWIHANRVGTTMAKRRGRHWALSHGAIQRLGEAISDNRVDLDPDQLEAFVHRGCVDLRPDQRPRTPHPAVSASPFGPFCVGILRPDSDALRWKRPRAYRLPGAPAPD